jgi:hypothetical protein
MVTPALLPLSDDDLKAYWKFDQVSGTVYEVSESSAALGTPANITMSGGTYGVSTPMSNLGTGVLFDSVDDYGYCGTSTSQWNFISNSSGLASFNFWAKFPSAPSEETFIGTVYTEGTQVGLLIRIHSTMKILWHISRGVDATRTISFSSGNDYLPDTTDWHMYTYRYDFANQIPDSSTNATLHRDNGNQKTGNVTGSSASNANNTFPMQIARRDASPAFYANYEACEWSMWNRILSLDDIEALYGEGGGREIY